LVDIASKASICCPLDLWQLEKFESQLIVDHKTDTRKPYEANQICTDVWSGRAWRWPRLILLWVAEDHRASAIQVLKVHRVVQVVKGTG